MRIAIGMVAVFCAVIGGAAFAEEPRVVIDEAPGEKPVNDPGIVAFLASSSMKMLVGAPFDYPAGDRPAIGLRISEDEFFGCDRTLPQPDDAAKPFYDACQEAQDMIASDEIPEKSLSEGEVDDAETTDGGELCRIVNGEPAPADGQSIDDFMRNKAICSSVISSRS